MDSEKASRVNDAYGRLKSDILHARLPPGMFVTEPEIALRLGMSRTPAREALIKLEAEGLVELVPRRGARILPLVAEDMREIYQILTALEPDAAAEIARAGISSDNLELLQASTAEMEAALDRKDLDDWAEADDRFHRQLMQMTGNRRLIAIVAQLNDQAHRARIITLRLRELPVKSTEDHRAILDALTAGDEDMVRALFRTHRERAGAELLGILENLRFMQI
ncbi:GntR family transcriptional regulator [Paracoccus sp. (in: a-proteobacteria)]|uniref:GntR family transcriptional regulator n=1 Tax=Paracoccus sp. TaxID=267 RepID=UPI0040595DC2